MFLYFGGSDILERKSMTASDKLVLFCILGDAAAEKNPVKVNMSGISELLGMSRGTVQRCVARLECEGELARTSPFARTFTIRPGLYQAVRLGFEDRVREIVQRVVDGVAA